MADFKDKYSGKQYRIQSHADLKSAVESNPVVDGRKHEIFSGSDAIKILPYRITQGDQAKFFPGLKEGTSDGRIATASGIIRDTERGIVYVPLKMKDYQNNLIGVNSHISSTFSSSTYLKLSAAFVRKFSGVSPDSIVLYGAEEFYTSPSASRSAFTVGPMTASYAVVDAGDFINEQYSAIHSGSLIRDFSLKFPSTNFITHWSVRMSGGSVFDYSSSIYVESASFRFNGDYDNHDTGSVVLSDNQFASAASGASAANGVVRYINPKHIDDGAYTEFFHKTRLAGDADSGSKYTAFPGNAQIIVYPPATVNNRHSASFQYHPTDRNLATGSSTIKTLFFYSGSGASSEAHPDYGFFISRSGIAYTNALNKIPSLGSGMHGASLHPTIKLRRTASAGYYSPSGSQYSSSIYVQTASGVTSGKGPVWGYLYETGN